MALGLKDHQLRTPLDVDPRAGRRAAGAEGDERAGDALGQQGTAAIVFRVVGALDQRLAIVQHAVARSLRGVVGERDLNASIYDRRERRSACRPSQ